MPFFFLPPKHGITYLNANDRLQNRDDRIRRFGRDTRRTIKMAIINQKIHFAGFPRMQFGRTVELFQPRPVSFRVHRGRLHRAMPTSGLPKSGR